MITRIRRASSAGILLSGLAAGIIFLSVSSYAPDRGDELARFFNYYNQNGMFNGVVLASADGKTIYEQAFGFADFEAKTPLTPASVFSLGSVTKTMTAAGILMLEEKGQLSINDGILKYFPDFPSFMKGVTIRHLLTHTSGIVDYLGRGLNLHKKVPVTDAIAIDALKSQASLQFEPGSKSSYSNSNYVLLAQIIRKASGKSYAEFMRKNIFTPLDMKDSFVYGGDEDILKKAVKSYSDYWEFNDENYRLKTNGDGCVYATAGDVLKFADAFFSGRLVSPESLKEALYQPDFKPRRPNDGSVYGYGWEISGKTPDETISHRGSIAGFCGQLWRQVKDRSTLIILCNTPSLVAYEDLLPGAENIMKGHPAVLGKKSAAQLFWDNWYVKGFEAGWSLLKDAFSTPKADFFIEPWEIHWIGYACLQRKETPRAIEVFRYSLEMFPGNPHLLDSLGEAYLAAGDKAKAVASYKKALEIDPKFESSIKALKELGEIK